MQAVLVALYVGALLAIRFGKAPKAESRAGLLARTLFSLQHSTLAFLNASFVFAIAMLCASLMSFAKKRQQLYLHRVSMGPYLAHANQLGFSRGPFATCCIKYSQTKHRLNPAMGAHRHSDHHRTGSGIHTPQDN